MKSNSASPGGSLQSKPTWLNASWVFRHVGFFCFRQRGRSVDNKNETDKSGQFNPVRSRLP